MKRRNYKFTNKKHPWQAIASLILGVISLLSMGAVIYLSFRERGLTRPGYGLTGFLAVIFTLAGVILGLLSLRERECFKSVGMIGIIVNAVVLLGTGFLFSVGLR